MQINDIKAIVSDELALVENTITELQFNKNIPLIHDVITYITENSGKRLRPLVLILTAKMFSCSTNAHIELASALEFIHTATLIHDDVVDDSMLRRGKLTVHKQWTNSTSILIGDYLYSLAFKLLSQQENRTIIELFSSGTTQIAEGEIMQLVNRHNYNISLEKHLEILQLKTGKLFEIATQAGALVTQQSSDMVNKMRQFGAHLGLAYQLVDDALDFKANVSELGKNIGDDLAKGNTTLPVLYAISHGTSEQAEILEMAIKNGDTDKLPEIQQIIFSTGAIEHVLSMAKKYINLAIEKLEDCPDNSAKHALINLAKLSLERNH